MKNSESHSRGDHLMERPHGAKHSFFGLWRCHPCGGDFVSPVPRAKKYRERKKRRKDLNDPNFDPDFVKSSKKAPEKEDRKDPNFYPSFVKSSHKVPAEEDRKDPNFIEDSQPTMAKKDRKDRSLRSLMNDSEQPKPREDHLLLENQSWRKEGDTEENWKEDSQSHRGKINEQLQPTSRNDGNELKSQAEKNLEGKDAADPSPTGKPETESLKHSEPVNNKTISDEPATKETHRQGSQSHRGKGNGEVQSKSQEDRHELEPPNEDMENLEEKDAVPSHPDLAKSQSLEQAKQVNDSSASDEAGGKENEQKEDSPSHRAKMNGQPPATSQPDGHEHKGPEENVGKSEETDAVPSHPGRAKSQNLEQAKQVNNSSASDEAVGNENDQKEDSQSQRAKMNGQPPATSQPDGHEHKGPAENVGKSEETDGVPSHPGLAKSQSLEQAKQVNDSSVSDEASGKENEQKEDSPSQRAKMNGQPPATSQPDGHEHKGPEENMGKSEETNAVPSHPGLEKSQSLEQAKQENDSSVSNEGVGKENEQKEDSPSQRAKMNGQPPATSQPDGHEHKDPEENVGKSEETDAVPSHPGLAKSQSLEQAKQINDSSVSDEAGGKENEQKEDSPSERAKMNGQPPATSQRDGHEHKGPEENVGKSEETDVIPSKNSLPITEFLEHLKQDIKARVSDEGIGKENDQKEDSPSQRAKMNGQPPATSQPDGHEHKGPEENVRKSEETDVIPSYNSLPITEFLEHLKQDIKATVSDEGIGKENDQKEDSPSQRAKMKGQRPATSQPDRHEHKGPEENVGKSEETDAIPSYNSLPITEFLGHLKPDIKATVSDEGARDGDMVSPDVSQGQLSQTSQTGSRSAMQSALKKAYQHAKHLKADSLEELDPGHNTIAAHVGGKGEVEHLGSPPPEYLKQFSQTSGGEEGGKTIHMLIHYWEEQRQHHPEDVVPEGKFQHRGSQKLEIPKEFNKAGSTRLSRPGSQSGAEHLESPRNQSILFKQSSAIEAAGQNTDIPQSESYESPQEAEGEKVTPTGFNGLQQTQNEIFGASGFREAEQEWDHPELDGDGLHSARDEKLGASKEADPNHSLTGLNSVRHQEMEGKKLQDDLRDKQTHNGDQEDHYTRNTGLLPQNLEDLHRANATIFSNVGSGDRFEHPDDPYPDHEKGEMMQDDFIEKQIHGGAEDPEECFPNSQNLEEFLTRNGLTKGASNSAHGDGSSISSSHDHGKAGSTCLWDRVSTHDIGEDKTGHLYRDHSHHIGHSHRFPHQTDHGEAAAQSEETSAWKLGFFSVPHIVVVGALTALSVLGKAAN